MEKEVNVKRQGSEAGDGGGDAVKRQKMAAICDVSEAEDGEDMMAWLTLDDEAMTELSKLLDSETTPQQQGCRVRFIEDPYSPPVIFQSSAYITINGNEESCGSSFSDLDSSMMASIDMGGVTGVFGGLSKKENGCAWGPDADEARGWMLENDALETERLLVNDAYGCDWSNRWIDDGDHTDDSIWTNNFLGDM
nr:Protein SON like [Ipomoea batatas]GME20419.1 Protein SON like [Ipomoea batatas]